MVDIVVADTPLDADRWDRLVESAEIPTPFARSWWLQAWSGPRSRIVHVLDGGELVGGVALESERVRGIELVRLLGHVLAPDHCDLLARPGYETTVVSALSDWFARPGQRRIRLEGIATGAALLDALPPGDTTAVLDRAPWQCLPADFPSYLATRSRMLRKNISRYRRQTVDQGLRHHVVAASDAEFGLAEMRRLHSISFGAKSSFLPHFDVFARAAARGIEKGEVLLHTLVDGDRAVAVEVVFQVAGRVSTYQSGRDTSDPRIARLGTTLMSHVIEHAIESGCRELDMLRGSQDYKRFWANDSRDILSVRVASGRVATGLERSVAGLRRMKRTFASLADARSAHLAVRPAHR
ncbi:GNAT family N-acetyltransferase [Mycobacterium sp. 155]|uniref:GNAT family N-acetyltransferase n=1 Tax=Mycobacterium sp. 155 TaxID=1157943 RepID=UPI00037EE8FD|nr:GNAT family N-acetyltransferase [Mycobacterium sp. 155]